MASAEESRHAGSVIPSSGVPQTLRALLVAAASGAGQQVAEALSIDDGTPIWCDEVHDLAAALRRLRDEAYDVVLVCHGEGLDARELLGALQGGGSEQATVVLSSVPEQELTALGCEAGADACCCLRSITTPVLVHAVTRAIERRRLISENARLRQWQQHRRRMEQDETAWLFRQQCELLSPCELFAGEHESTDRLTSPILAASLPRYRELLHAYVTMGSGTLRELNPFVEGLAAAGVTASGVLQLHLHALEQMLQGLGPRSARHVMNRAQRLVLEIFLLLDASSRRRSASQSTS